MKKNSRLLLILTILLCAACLTLAATLHMRDAKQRVPAADSTETAETSEEQEQTVTEAATEATVFFASDYQAEDGWPSPAEALTGILEAVKNDGAEPDNVVYCGDYTNDPQLYDYQLSPDESIAAIREIVRSELGSVPQEDMIFVQGNHDHMTDEISASGLHEYDGYLVYVLNTQDDFPWKQGRVQGCLAKTRESSQKMKECFDGLIARGETRPVFIAGHVPLHFTGRTSSRHGSGDNLYSSLIFDVVNDAARDLDIVYMTGHNHSKGWDCYLGGSCIYKAPGDKILIPEFNDSDRYTDIFTEETLNFTYLNAGYTGYYMNCGLEEVRNGTSDQYHAADETLTGTVCEIRPDEIVISRYAADGLHALGSEGEADPYNGGIDAGLIESKYYSGRVESPQHIERRHGNSGS